MPKKDKKDKKGRMALIVALIKKGVGKGKPIKKENEKKSLAEKINFGGKYRKRGK